MAKFLKKVRLEQFNSEHDRNWNKKKGVNFFSFFLYLKIIKLWQKPSLDRSMSGNGSCWNQFYNGWGWTSSMTSPHHFMEFDNSERLRSMELCFSCFWDLVERKENFHLPFVFCQQHQTRKEQEEVILLPLTVCWKPATLHALQFPNPDLHGLPKGRVEGFLPGSKARGRVEVLSVLILVQYCTPASAGA